MLRLTELSGKSADSAEMRSGALGHCRHFFWLGVAFDTVGVAVLFTGVFANLLFYDMMLYLGSIIIFVSLLWWIFWYTGNIEALPEDPLRRTSPRAGEVGTHRSGSRRFSLTIRSVSNTFRRIRRRRRRRRLLPRVLQMMSSLSSTDPGQLEGNSDAWTEGGRTSFHPAKPVSILNKLQLCSIQASKSLPLVPLQHPLTICTSRSQPVFSVTSQCYPLESGASGSYSQMVLSSDSQVPVDLDPQERSKISVASRIYPVQRVDSQSHLLVPVPSESSPVVPLTSQSQVQDSVSSGSYMTVDLDPQGRSKISVASRIYPVQRVDSQSHLLVPVPSESSPVVPLTSQSQVQDSVSYDSSMPVDLDPQGRSKISMASWIYPVQRVDSQSHLLVPVPSESSPVVPLTSQSQVQDSVSYDSSMPVDLGPQGRSKISVASRIYPVQRVDSQSHLLVPVPSESSPVVPLTSQSQVQDSVSYDSSMPVDLGPHLQGRSKISVASRIYPVQRVDSQSHLLVPVPSESSPVVPLTSQSQVQDSVSSGSYMTVDLDPQGRSKISVASRIYPVQRVDSQSHLLVPMPSESSPVVPVTSQSQNPGSVAKEGQLQNLPSASQTQPETGKASESHTLGMEVPVVPLGFAQTSQSRSSRVQEVAKNSSAKASETLPAISQKLAEEQLDPSLIVSEVTHSDRQCDPTGNLPATSGVRKSHPF
ncbi:uncharacterized protein LOC130878004 [Chionomys nivalis]|uniref:uncharacterized protein LOC130878004 n=1 Tax=Chionomys nivalis TaxID=269649 RepID=UPI002598C5FC|nr:uncharacterized protein LOC130878004 [Chionomys nivalis]